MNARILALGAILALTASAVEAQAPKKAKGHNHATAEESARKVEDRDHKAKRGGDDEGYGRRGPMGGGMMGGRGNVLAGITLTDAQKTRVQAIRQSYKPRMEALRDSAKTAHEDKMQTAADTAFRSKAKALMISERAEVRAVLTTEQQVRFDANAKKQDERMARFGERGRGNRPGGRDR